MKHYFSFSLMLAGVKNILFRFPFSAIIAMIGTLLAIALTYEDLISKEIYSEFVKSIYICALAIPLFISIRLYLEASVYKPLYHIFIKIMALLLLGVYYWQMPSFLNNEFYIQFFFTIVALQLSVTFIGFLNFKYTNDNVVWQFNKILILRFLGASFATLILFAGLALALVAMDVLLEFNIDEDNYLRLWIFLSGVFFTYFFLAGITEISRISSDVVFLNSLKIFLLYVIIPILIVFSLILNLYLLKIIISWNIPKGWVIYLVSGYFALGLGTSILLFPLRNISYNKIFNFFKHSFFYTTLPFIIVYFVAVIIRVQQYGFTENRLIALILGAWMGLINLYFLFFKNYRLVIIPLSLTIMMLIAVYGPWSIFRISEYNQRGELLKVFKENNLVQNGKVVAAAKPVEKHAALRIIDILDYFNKKERMTFLQPLFYQNLDSLFNQDTFNLYNYKKDALLKILNISEKEYYSTNSSFNFYSESN